MKFSLVCLGAADHFWGHDAPSLINQQLTVCSLKEVFRDVKDLLKSSLEFSFPLKELRILERAWENGPNRELSLTLNVVENRDMKTLAAVAWGSKLGQLRIEYLPNSVEYITVENCGQEYPLNTRCLPRHLKQFHFQVNLLYGSLDLQHLPPEMIHFGAIENKFSGKIILKNLPRTLLVIDLRHNQFRHASLYYCELPSALREVNVRHTSIKKACAMREEWNADEKRIFMF